MLPIVAFFFLGDPAHAVKVLGPGTPGYLLDFGRSVGQYLGPNNPLLPVGVLAVGLLSGIDGFGFSGLPLTGSISGALTGAGTTSTAVLASLGQIGSVWVGGGTMVPWSGVCVAAALANIRPRHSGATQFRAGDGGHHHIDAAGDALPAGLRLSGRAREGAVTRMRRAGRPTSVVFAQGPDRQIGEQRIADFTHMSHGQLLRQRLVAGDHGLEDAAVLAPRIDRAGGGLGGKEPISPVTQRPHEFRQIAVAGRFAELSMEAIVDDLQLGHVPRAVPRHCLRRAEPAAPGAYPSRNAARRCAR